MIEKIFKNKYDKLVAKELANKVISIILSIALAIATFTIYQLSTNQKTIILPAKVDKEFWVTSNELSEVYLKQIGSYLTQALFNVSPNNAKEQFLLILDFAAPSFYQKLKSEMVNQAKYIVQNGITSSFYPKSFKFEKDFILISGTKHHIIGDKVVEKKEITVTFSYVVQNGRFYISNLKIKQ